MNDGILLYKLVFIMNCFENIWFVMDSCVAGNGIFMGNFWWS